MSEHPPGCMCPAHWQPYRRLEETRLITKSQLRWACYSSAALGMAFGSCLSTVIFWVMG